MSSAWQKFFCMSLIILGLSCSFAPYTHATDPSSISGLKVWLRSDSLVYNDDGTTLATNGQTVRRWNDKSGNSNNFTQSTSGARPTLVTNVLGSYPSVRFDATDDVLVGPDALAGTDAISIFTVWSMDSSNGRSLSISKHGAFNAASGEWTLRQAESNNIRATTQFLSFSNLDAPDFQATDRFTGTPTYSYTGVTWAGGEAPTMYQNGVTVTSSVSTAGWSARSAMPTTTDPLRIGYVPNLHSPSGGNVVEVLIFNRKLTSLEVASVNDYLRTRYFTKQIVYDGDSLTAGKDSGTASTNWRPYPTQTYPLLNFKDYVTYNFGVSGQGSTAMSSDAASQIDTLYDSTLRKNVLVAWDITNEIAFGTSAATAYSNFVSYCQARRAAGWKVIVMTVLPRTDTGVDADFETKRTSVNTLIRSNWSSFADSLVDVAADTRIGDAGDDQDLTYYLDDDVHLNNTGAGVVASLVAPAINALLEVSSTTLTSDNNPSDEGEAVTLTATVSPSTATGTVTFKDSSTTIGTATLGQGSGVLTVSNLSAGTHTLRAVYGGNSTFSGSTSLAVSQVVTALPVSSSSSSSSEEVQSGGGGGGGGYRGSRSPGTSPLSPSSSSGRSSSSLHFAAPAASSASSQASLLTVSVDGSSVTYMDVPTTEWFAPYVSSVVKKGIAQGYKDSEGNLTGEFGVSNPVTAAEALKMSLMAAGKQLSEGTPSNPYAQGDWSAPYVKTAEDLKLSVYVSSLDVRQPTTRGEVMQTLLETFGVAITSGENPFSDLSTSSRFAPAILTAYHLGILSGDTDQNGNLTGTVRPNDPVNRAEMAKLIDVMMSKASTLPHHEAASQDAPVQLSEEPLQVLVHALNARWLPSLDAPVRNVLSKGEVVILLRTDGPWAYVRMPDGRNGYVVRDKLGPVEGR
jgi:lysophospholipase L1-like esterase